MKYSRSVYAMDRGVATILCSHFVFCANQVATLLWLRTKNFMDRGVELTWISAFPHEKEFLFAPLTYLKPLHQEPLICTIGGVTYQVVEVSAQM